MQVGLKSLSPDPPGSNPNVVRIYSNSSFRAWNLEKCENQRRHYTDEKVIFPIGQIISPWQWELNSILIDSATFLVQLVTHDEFYFLTVGVLSMSMSGQS